MGRRGEFVMWKTSYNNFSLADPADVLGTIPHCGKEVASAHSLSLPFRVRMLITFVTMPLPFI